MLAVAGAHCHKLPDGYREPNGQTDADATADEPFPGSGADAAADPTHRK